MKRYFAILEDDARRSAAMLDALQAIQCNLEPVIFESAHTMIEWLEHHWDEIRMISLDHDLPIRRDENNELIDFGDGRIVSTFLSRRTPICRVIVHTSNVSARAMMRSALQDAHWSIETCIPFEDTTWISGTWANCVSSMLLR